MEATANQTLSVQEPFQAAGIVIDFGSNDVARVRTEDGVVKARRAFSCLVQPEPGDRVLVARQAGAGPYLIAVLERSSGVPVRLSVDRDLCVAVKQGRFSVAAALGVDIVSARDMDLTASKLNVRASEGNVALNRLSYIGQWAFTQIERIKLVGGLFDTLMERVSQRVKRSYRVVEELDHLRSEEIDHRARRNLSLKGQNMLLNADDLVKVDADQIHLG